MDLAARMNAADQRATPEMVHAIMSNTTSRILNGITAFTSVMNSATGYYNTTVRATAGATAATPGAVPPTPQQQKSWEEGLVEAGRAMLQALLALDLEQHY